MKPHWSAHSLPTHGDRSLSAQEDEARDQAAEREADIVFTREEAVMVAVLRTAIQPHKLETRAAARLRVAKAIEAVITQPDRQLSDFYPWVAFADDYGAAALRRAFVQALAQPDHITSDEVIHA